MVHLSALVNISEIMIDGTVTKKVLKFQFISMVTTHEGNLCLIARIDKWIRTPTGVP